MFGLFGFDPAAAQADEDGTVIIRAQMGSTLQAGFKAAAPAEVRTLMERLHADGVTIVERNDDAAYGGFKCLDPDGCDPDGRRIEVSGEPPRVR